MKWLVRTEIVTLWFFWNDKSNQLSNTTLYTIFFFIVMYLEKSLLVSITEYVIVTLLIGGKMGISLRIQLFIAKHSCIYNT